MKTASKVLDGVVIVSGLAVGIGAIMPIISGIKEKKFGTVAIGVLTIVIASYAFKQAVTKINA